MARILLFQKDDAIIRLDAVDGGQEWQAGTLQIERAGALTTYPLDPVLTLPKDLTVASGNDFVFQPSTAGTFMASAFFRDAAAGPLPFLGRTFDFGVGYTAELRIVILAQDQAHFQAQAFLEVCGQLKVRTDQHGVDLLAGTRVCFQLELDLKVIPSLLPRLRVRLPDFIRQLPDFDLPWPPGGGLPDLPWWPWNFSWPAFEFPSLFLKLTWRRIAVFEKDPAHDDHTIVVEVIGLRLAGPTGSALEGDLHLEIAEGRVTTGTYFDLRADPVIRLQISGWYSSAESLAIGWTGNQLEAWLRLILPEVLAPPLPAAAGFTLRVLHDTDGVGEVRLDFAPAATDPAWQLKLPGFAVEVPQPKYYSAVVAREDEEWRATLLSTFAGGDRLSAFTTFGFAHEDEGRRLHDDEENQAPGNDPLVKLTATFRAPLDPVDNGDGVDDEDGVLESPEARPEEAWTSLALVSLSLADGKPRFIEKAVRALLPLDFADVATLEPPGLASLARLSLDDADFALTINAAQLPFLKRDGFEPWQQFLEVTVGAPELVAPPVFRVGLTLRLHLGALLNDQNPFDLATAAKLNFDWERFAFSAEGLNTVSLTLAHACETHFLGMDWTFAGGASNALFDFVLADENFLIKQSNGAKIEARFTKLTSPAEPLIFDIRGFTIGPAGVSLEATMRKCHAMINGVATRFEFDEASFQVRDNRITGFTVTGSGPLPPALVGEATAAIALQFGQGDSGGLELLCAHAELRGRNLLRCESTRFELTIDGLGLRFVNDHGDYHLYFTLTGTARFRPLPGDDSEGPLSWLPKIEIQFVDCPLCGDARVLRDHIRFHIELPKKVKFSFLGCFEFELRGIGFDPGVDFWEDHPAAMQLGGQIKFAIDGGDVVDARFDFHNLFIALPAPGDSFPRLHCAGLGIKLRVGEAFELDGEVDFLNGEEIEPGWKARGFRGHGSVTLMGLPKITATFAFLRVLREQPSRWERAWFLYAEVGHLSIRIPTPIPIFIREVGLGFGYRYTLAMIKKADETDDVRLLMKELDRLALSQGNLSSVAAWRIDMEEPDETPRWTVVLRAMIATSSSSSGVTDWHPDSEKYLPNIVLMDAVMALRSDFTFFLNARLWIFTNYYDFDTDHNDVRARPLLFGYAMFQPRKKRLLAHAASNRNPAFGGNPPLWPFLEEAFKSSYFSATLLIEPGLFHMELGWPNVLRWGMKAGPFDAECRGGTIFRISRHEMVQGLSFEARGHLSISAGFDFGFVGASLSAEARVAFGARYIIVIGLDRIDRSAFYGAVGLEIYVKVAIHLVLRFYFRFWTLELNFGFSFEIGFTALLEVGATLTALPGCRGTATICVSLMGHGLRFGVHVGIGEGTVNRAVEITSSFLNIGLEATEVQPLPGESAAKRNGNNLQPLAAAAPAAAPEMADGVDGVDGVVTDGAPLAPNVFVAPDYEILTVPIPYPAGREPEWLFVLVPSVKPPKADGPGGGFLPAPPTEYCQDPPERGLSGRPDFRWAPGAAAANMQRYIKGEIEGADHDHWEDPANSEFAWQIHWNQEVGSGSEIAPTAAADQPEAPDLQHAPPIFAEIMVRAFKRDTEHPFVPTADPEDLDALAAAGGTTQDQRVGDPSDACYETAVRGTMEQFEGSPYLRHDPDVEYERLLKEAFAETTSLYSPADEPQGSAKEDPNREPHELRSTIVSGLVEDVKAFAELLAANAAAQDAPPPAAAQAFAKKSVAFTCGLVFRFRGATPPWMSPSPTVDVGQIWQRLGTGVDLPADAEGRRNVRAYNTHDTTFSESPPTFTAVRQVAAAATVGLTWDLRWPEASANGRDEAEDHLRFYRVLRRPLGAQGPEQEFQVKPCSIQHRVVMRDSEGQPVLDDHGNVRNKIITLPARFRFVDHFREETAGDVAALPPEGRRYLYTITPVDLAGTSSPRPLSIVAIRRPNQPPSTPLHNDLAVIYEIDEESFAPVGEETTDGLLLTPQAVSLRSAAPLLTDDDLEPAAVRWRLVLRREQTLPIGSYPADSATENPRQSAPASNARVLPGDIVIELQTNPGDLQDPALAPAELDAEIKERLKEWTLDEAGQTLLAALRGRAVLPLADGSGHVWQPAAWRAFLQAVSSTGVPSALSPIQLRLLFHVRNSPAAREERRPETLEWILRPLRPEILDPLEGQAAADPADVPRPVAGEDGAAVLLDPLKLALKEQPLSFLPHPKLWRAACLRWNVTGSQAPAWRTGLLSAFRVFEFDVDPETAEVLEDPALTLRGFLDHARQVRETRLLPAGQVPLTPSENLAPDQWEAWHASSARRLWLHEKAGASASTGRGVDRWLSNWFSWRDARLEWPRLPGGWAEVRQAGGEPVSSPERVRISTANGLVTLQLITDTAGWTDQQLQERGVRLQRIARMEFVELVGFATPASNGLKRLQASDADSFTFRQEWFDPVPAGDWDVVLAQPRAHLHWFLEQLIGDIASAASTGLSAETARLYGVAADPPLLPPGRATDLEGFRLETPTGTDPYGWNVLKRFGLAAAVTFRNIRLGRALLAEEVWPLIQAQLQRYGSDAELQAFLPHLHVELLFQPARSVRLDLDPDATPNEQDLLALIQFSLRPVVRPAFEFYEITLKTASHASIPTKMVQITAAGADGFQADLLLPGMGGAGVVLTDQQPGYTAELSPLADGSITILARTIGCAVTAAAADFAPSSRELGVADLRRCLFADAAERWMAGPDPEFPAGAELGEDEPHGPGEEAHVSWWRLDRYARLAGCKDPQGKPWVDQLNSPETVEWLRRFFNFSNDFNFKEENGQWLVDDDPHRPAAAGPWIATAYLQANALQFVAPRRGRAEIYHLIDDGWAHAFRYFIQPLLRYDQLWLALAQSETLFPFAAARARCVAKLLDLDATLALPQDGGLDIAIPRLRRVAPPLVLSSKRLDRPSAEGATEPAATWEVILAKHPEQSLIERNRTLLQRLEFRHVAYAMFRRFGFLAENDSLFTQANQADAWTQVQAVEDTYGEPGIVLPGAVTRPDYIPLPADPAHVSDDQRTLLLADRHDSFAQEAIAFQWRNLPFFYEHRVLFKAEAAAVSSPAIGVSHREFSFHSPEPVAIEDAEVDESLALSVKIRLNNYWESLPDDARDEWRIEDPATVNGEETRYRFKPAALPDTGVAYEIIHRGNALAAVEETAAVVAFERTVQGDAYQWGLRATSARFDAQLAGLEAPGSLAEQPSPHRYLLGVRIRPKFASARLDAPIRKRADFDETAPPFPQPLLCVPPAHFSLVLTGPLSEEESAQLRQLSDTADPSLAAALRSLAAQAPTGPTAPGEPDPVTTAVASPGLEQLEEVQRAFTGRLALDGPARTLSWCGGLTAEDAVPINAWKTSTPFFGTIDALLAAAAQARNFEFTAPQFQPPADLPPGLALADLGASAQAGERRYRLDQAAGLLTAAAWQAVQNPSNAWPAELKAAIDLLRGDLAQVTVDILEPDWQLRPDEAQLTAGGLAAKLLLGRGRITSSDLLSRTRAAELLQRLRLHGQPAQDVIRRLYRDSLTAALAGGSLRLRTRRSTARVTAPVLDNITTAPL